MASVETANVEMFHHEGRGRRREYSTDLGDIGGSGQLLLAEPHEACPGTLHNSVVSGMHQKSRGTSGKSVYKDNAVADEDRSIEALRQPSILGRQSKSMRQRSAT
jgi:hypothetical protein